MSKPSLDELFREFIKKNQLTPTSQMNAKYEKPIKEAVPFKKNALQPKLKDDDFKIK
jgi:hypothetical protein